MTTTKKRSPDDVRMFPTLEMAPPKAVTAPSSSSGRRGPAKKLHQPAPRGSVESRQLPGLLKTTKPSILPTTSANDISVMVGFNAASVQFDGELPQYSEDILMKTRARASKQAGLSLNDVGEYAAENMEVKDPASPDHDGGERGGTGGGAMEEKMSESGSPQKQMSHADAVVDELRNYTTLMDKFSLHNFVIYYGETLKNTPEFQSFRREYSHEWGAVSYLIAKLEKLLSEFHVKLAIISGPELHKLASLNPAAVTKDQILKCISNIDQIKPQLKSTVSNADGEEDVSADQQLRAVIKVQAHIRRLLSRRRVRRIRLRLLGCIRIQAHLRKVVYRKFGLDRLKNAKNHQDGVWKDNQEALARLCKEFEQEVETQMEMPAGKSLSFGRHGASRKEPKDNRRLIIHIPSISANEYTRLNMSGFQALQNAHIGALYQLIDPDVHVIYITPVTIGAAEQAYHDKFLDMLGISTLPKRLHFIQPELIHRLPHHLPLAQVLWCSTVALHRVKQQVKKIRNCTIVTGNVTWLERRIANILNVPVLSSEPVVAESVKSRSYAKKVFMESNVNIPIGAHDIFSQEDLYIALSRLVASNLDVNRWLIRLNFDYNGEATVILDVKRMNVVHALRAEQATLFEQNFGNTGSWYSRPVQLSVRKRIVEEMKAKFSRIVRINRPDLYPSLDSFVSQMRHIGAVVEAEPLEKLGCVDALCYVAPDGTFRLFAHADVLQDDKYQTQAYVAPNTMLPPNALEGATGSIANYLHKKWRVIGYFTVSYCAFWDGLDQIPRLWATGLHFGMTPQFGAFGTAGVAINPMPFVPKEYIPVYPPKFDPVDMDGLMTSEKHCLYVPYMMHGPLQGTRDDAFFKFCQMRGISFDKFEKTGTLFFLVDSLMSGATSMMVIANSRYRVFEEAVNNLTFITQQFGMEANSTGLYDELTSTLINLRKNFKKEEQMI